MTEQRNTKKQARELSQQKGISYVQARRELFAERVPGESLEDFGDLQNLLINNPEPGRLILGDFKGRTLASERDASLLVIGPTRSGKTASFLMPNLLDWDGPAVVTCTAGELLINTIGHRQKLGPVYIYDPTEMIGDPEGRIGYQTCTYSILSRCFTKDRRTSVTSPDWDSCIEVADNVTDALVKNGGSNNDWEYWKAVATQILAPCLYAAAIAGLEMDAVCRWIDCGDVAEPPTNVLVEPLKILREVSEGYNNNPRFSYGPNQAITLIESALKRPTRELATDIATLQNQFHVYFEEVVKKSSLSSNFSPEEFLNSKGTLFLISPTRRTDKVAFLLNSIFDDVVEKAFRKAEQSPEGRLTVELGLFLEEFEKILPLRELNSLVVQGASRGIVLLLTIADMNELRTRFGDQEVATLVQNHRAKVILPGEVSAETLDFIGKVTRQNEAGQGVWSFPDLDQTEEKSGRENPTALLQSQLAKVTPSEAVDSKRVPALTPAYFQTLEQETAILIYQAKELAKLTQRPWFKVGRYLSYANEPYKKL